MIHTKDSKDNFGIFGHQFILNELMRWMKIENCLFQPQLEKDPTPSQSEQ
jgi:hypothetical protein